MLILLAAFNCICHRFLRLISKKDKVSGLCVAWCFVLIQQPDGSCVGLMGLTDCEISTGPAT